MKQKRQTCEQRKAGLFCEMMLTTTLLWRCSQSLCAIIKLYYIYHTEDARMVISYKKPWKLLIDLDLRKKDLMAMAGIMRKCDEQAMGFWGESIYAKNQADPACKGIWKAGHGIPNRDVPFRQPDTAGLSKSGVIQRYWISLESW